MVLVIREYLMMNKYNTGAGESVSNPRPDLFPLMMYIYYGILFLMVLSSFTRSHALRLVSTSTTSIKDYSFLSFRQYAKKKFNNAALLIINNIIIINAVCLTTKNLRKSSNRVDPLPAPLSSQTRAQGDTDHPMQLQP